MIITKKSTPQGEIISLENPVSQEKAVINATIGATLIQLDLAIDEQIESIIALPGSEKYALEENPYHPSALLAPWVNRVRNGNYSFLGRNYQLPINEPSFGNAIHGFLARKPFVLSHEESHSDYCKATFSYEYDGQSFEGFPFAFTFDLTYNLSVKGKLEIHFHIQNQGKEKMPFACGWHPYFGFQNMDIQACEVKFSAISKFISDSQMIPFKSETVDYQKGAKLSDVQLDNVFLLEKSTYHTSELSDLIHNKSIYIGHSSEIFPYFVAFVPEGYSCIALEPMTANTDAFNTLEGLISLEANEEFNGKVEVWVGKSSAS